ncbi:U3 small nucleolar ribonucleoprotein protein MPP10 [Schistocerca americana]|uniref:U3 small nucleolar ribonucleoprotein protein MPP10 n=1 Tax=Schistocerca americana TaxID=7009 RepID=UPI001F4F7F35|nr:U3 small nucleolar ribonucleoprotein protein MPP10 [Schistocerca americana]
MASAHVLDEVRDKFENFIKKPENYLKVQNELADSIKLLVKTLYDYTKSAEDGSCGDALPELIIQDFDEEQIWQQLELQNEAVFGNLIDKIAFFTACKKRLQFPTTRSIEDDSFTTNDNPENHQSGRHESDSSENGSDDEVFSDHGDVRVRKPNREEEDCSSEPLEERDAEESESPRRGRNVTKLQRARGGQKTSVVDDKFFKLGEMEEFLDKEDRKENSNNRLNSKKIAGDKSDGQLHDDDDDDDDDDDNDDVESIDYFEDMPSEDSNDEGSALRAKYGDFFDEPDLGGHTTDRTHIDDQVNGRSNKRSVRFSLPAEEEEEDDDDEDEDEDDTERNVEQLQENEIKCTDIGTKQAVAVSEETTLSSLERRKARLDEKVAKLEQQALSEKPWQLTGEVGADTRPHNSLLEEAVEFDSVTRPAPVRTEKTTLKLEDIIRQRIKDRAWDDVVRKQKPVESPHEYRKRLILDQEKSKLSLAEVYEQEYLKQKEKTSNDAAPGQEKPEEEPAEHREIRTLVANLFSKLDALSNFHYTPKMVAPEVKVVTNLPAVSVEEVAPAATSDATLLAPEEVKSKPRGGGDIASMAEKTATDRKRERRRKKMAQKRRAQRMVEKQKVSGVLVRGSNISKLEDSGADRGIKSSTAFFNQLQDEVRGQVQRLSAAKRDASVAHHSVNAKKLKL